MSEYLFADKPYGIATHSVDGVTPAFVEYLQARHSCKLYIAQRLDKTTSGAMVFGKSPSAAEQLSNWFKERLVEKRYLFVTDRQSTEDQFVARSKIEQVQKLMSNTPDAADSNSETTFKRMKRSPFYELWEARPKTGKTHQVRIHAAQVGLNILGDNFYGGADFPHLCLHCESLRLPDGQTLQTPPPRFFERLGFLKDPELVQILSGIDRRLRLFDFFNNPNPSLRLLHEESPSYRLDMFGAYLWLYWYKETNPTAKDLERWRLVSFILNRPLFIRKMLNRGQDPTQAIHWHVGIEQFPENWLAYENNTQYEFRSHQGLSPGLFLDQRENRLSIKQKAKDKDVLNLFAYTCGFSVCAAQGGAKAVTTVDVSKAFIDWGKVNFQHNQLDPNIYEFYVADSFFFLERAKKKDRKFDLIILDPPSFSRSKDQVFSIEKHLPKLLNACWDVLSKQGEILFSTNYESWSTEELESKLRKILPKSKVTKAQHGFDYEIQANHALMKSFWIKKI